MLNHTQDHSTDTDISEDMTEDMVQLLDRKPGLYLRHTEKKGRGLFCMYPIKAGEDLEITPAIILNEHATEQIEPTILRDYVFKNGDISDDLLQEHDIEDADESSCVVMGIGSYCNDDVDYNAQVVYEEHDGTLYYTLQAIKDIPPHTEICTSYGDNWFQDRDMDNESEDSEPEDDESREENKQEENISE